MMWYDVYTVFINQSFTVHMLTGSTLHRQILACPIKISSIIVIFWSKCMNNKEIWFNYLNTKEIWFKAFDLEILHPTPKMFWINHFQINHVLSTLCQRERLLPKSKFWIKWVIGLTCGWILVEFTQFVQLEERRCVTN